MTSRTIAVDKSFFKEKGLALHEIARRYLCALNEKQLMILRCICRGINHEQIVAMAHLTIPWRVLHHSYARFLPEIPGFIRGQRFVTYLVGYYEGYRFITEGGNVDQAQLYRMPMSDDDFLLALRMGDDDEFLSGDEALAEGGADEAAAAIDDEGSGEAPDWDADDSA